MKKEVEIKNTLLDVGAKRTQLPRGKFRQTLLNPFVCSIGAAVGILGGVSSLVAGLFRIVIHALLAGDTAFDRVGTTLLIIAIPMMLVGSILLDEIEIKK